MPPCPPPYMYVCDRLFLARRPSSGTGSHGPLSENLPTHSLSPPPPPPPPSPHPLCPGRTRAPPFARRSSPRPGRLIRSAARPPEGAHTAAEGTPERAADNAQEGAVLVTGASRGIGRAVAAR